MRSRRQLVAVYALRLLFLVGRRLWKDHCLRMAAALTFHTVLSAVPLLCLMVAAARVWGGAQYVDYLVAVANAYLVPEAAAEMAGYIRDTAVQVRPMQLGLWGGLAFVSVAFTLLFSVEQMVNEIFRCATGRPVWLRVLYALVLMTLGPVALGASLYVTGKVLWSSDASLKTLWWGAATWIVLFFTMWWMPHRPTRKRHAAVAALVTAVGFELLKWAVAVYASHVGATWNYVYGAMAIVPLFLLWVYTGWVVFLFGVELHAALHEVRRYDRLTG